MIIICSNKCPSQLWPKVTVDPANVCKEFGVSDDEM